MLNGVFPVTISGLLLRAKNVTNEAGIVVLTLLGTGNEALKPEYVLLAAQPPLPDSNLTERFEET